VVKVFVLTQKDQDVILNVLTLVRQNHNLQNLLVMKLFLLLMLINVKPVVDFGVRDAAGFVLVVPLKLAIKHNLKNVASLLKPVPTL